MKKIPQGFLIVLEGIDGSGKTTLAERLTQALRQQDYQVVLTREPGGTEFGKDVRQLLQHSVVRPIPEAEFLLFSADRAHHIQTIVKPSLQNGAIVISDRMADSSMAYQGYGRGIDRDMITAVNRWALQNIAPHLTLYVKLDWNIALQRIEKNRGELTAFEKEKQEFFERVAQGFDTLFEKRSDVLRLDGTISPDDLFNQAFSVVMKTIAQAK